MKKASILIGCIFLMFLNAKAQYFQTGQDPSRIKWRQINTTNFQIIYPEEFEKQAQRISFVFDKVYEYGWKTLNFKPHKVSVVLHTQTVKSNGLMAWAPKRIELFTTPHQQIYAQDWLEQLAIHEFRHLVQIDKIQSELPGVVKFILGEQAAAMVVGAYLPFWFLEGDAVVTETALSNSGRGRSASFVMDTKALFLEKGRYSFDKAYLGSYRSYVPNHYKLGYLLVGKGREKYGPDIWENAVQKSGSKPWSVTPFNSAVKKDSGKNIKKLYEAIADDLTDQWKRELKSKQLSSFSTRSPERKNYTEYLYPGYYSDSVLFAYRYSTDDIGRFVLIDRNQKEQVIFTPGTIFEESVSLQKNLVIWAEKRSDIRWTHADQSVIQVLDIDSKKHWNIKAENKLFSPAISPDLKMFAAVEVDPANNFYLSVFDLFTGEMKFQFKTVDNQYFFTPCWDEKGENLYAVCLSSTGKHLAQFNIKSQYIKTLTSSTFANLKNPVYSNGKLIFSADFEGTDNLYELKIKDQSIFRMAQVAFGADYPAVSPSGKSLVFANYNSRGFHLAELPFNESTSKEQITDITLQRNELAESLAKQEFGIPGLSKSDTISYQSKKYSKIGHLFNFHSWAPVYIDVNNYEVTPGVSFFSQNKLGTAEARLGYEYNVSDKTGTYKAGFTYRGLFPEFNAELSYGNQKSNYFLIKNTVNQFNQVIKSDTTVQQYKWSETAANINVRLPLNFSRGKYSRIFYPEFKYTFNNVVTEETAPDNFYSGSYHAMTYRVYWYNLLLQSEQSLMPRWGQQIDLVYRHTPFIGNDLGTIAGIQSGFYLPGIRKNHGLKIYGGYQEKKFTKNYNFSNFVRFPRGFQSYQNNQLTSFSADYRFPIGCPDVSFSKLVYIKRIKSSIFYDYAWLSVPVIDKNGAIRPNDHSMEMNSLGIELTTDMHVLRFFAPIQLGVRSVYRPQFQDFTFDALLSVNFNGF